MAAVSPARSVAFAALQRFQRGAAADEALGQALARVPLVDGRDRALATTLVYGTIRRLGTIDYVLRPFLSRPIERLDPPVLAALRMAVYQILWLDRVPEHAVVHETVEQVKRVAGRGAAGFVNGVLRALLRGSDRIVYPDAAADPVLHLSVRHSHPEWLVRRYVDRLGLEETAALLEANNVAPVVSIRVNRLRVQPEKVAAALRDRGVDVEAGRYLPEALRIRAQAAPDQLPGFAEGWFTPQDEASMLVARVVDPQPGETVVDACAAPGTKTTHLAERMEDRGRVVALDLDAQRLRRVEENARRLRLSSIRTQVGDARQATALLGTQGADRVLVDAPCSGLGTLARRPDLRWRKRPEDIQTLARVQRQILDGVAPLVKPGGVLVYSTCTTEPEENQHVVREFLAGNPSFRLVPPGGLPAGLTPAAEGWLQLWPHRHGTDGFFIARLERMR